MLIEVQNSILKMVAQGDALDATFATLCYELERLLPGTRASILTLDTHGLLHPFVAPSLPDDYSAALDGIAIGPTAGSCGTAAYLRRVVVVDDIESDPRWSASKHLARAAGLKACFSSPIFGSRGQVLATFALYFDEPREPTAFEQSVVEGCLPLCMIAFERNERVLERERLAYTDALTGLTNRAKFTKDFETTPTSSWSLLLIDIDNLKSVNDTFGHAAGDDLIAVVEAEIPVGDLSRRVGISQSALSQHLKKLRMAGVVSTRREAQSVYYKCESSAVKQMLMTLRTVFKSKKTNSRHDTA